MSEKNFFERLQKNPRPVVVDFWAPWCGPCRMIEPMLKNIGNDYDGQVDVWKVNADENQELLRKLKIYGIPTVISFHNGEEVARQTGVGSQQSLAGLFEAALRGEAQKSVGLTPIDRVLRAAIGLALILLAYTGGFEGVFLFIALAGGGVLFSAIYDRCPIWKAVTSRIKELTAKKDLDTDK